MKTSLSASFMKLLFIAAIASPSVAVFAQVRVSPMPGQPVQPLTAVYPTTSFDREHALQALDKGHSTIVGKACSYHDSHVFMATGGTVVLFPATPYFDEWYKLRSQAEARHETARISVDAFATRVETRVDDNGRFQFTEMKPGRYYLAMAYSFDEIKSQDEYAGYSQADNLTINHYEQNNYVVMHDDQFARPVEVTRDGQIVETALTSGNGGILRKAFPCSNL